MLQDFSLYLDSTMQPSVGQGYKHFSFSGILVFPSAGGPYFFKFSCSFLFNFILKDLLQLSPQQERTIFQQHPRFLVETKHNNFFFVVRNSLEFFCNGMVSCNWISYSHFIDVISFKNNQSWITPRIIYKAIFTKTVL